MRPREETLNAQASAHWTATSLSCAHKRCRVRHAESYNGHMYTVASLGQGPNDKQNVTGCPIPLAGQSWIVGKCTRRMCRHHSSTSEIDSAVVSLQR